MLSTAHLSTLRGQPLITNRKAAAAGAAPHKRQRRRRPALPPTTPQAAASRSSSSSSAASRSFKASESPMVGLVETIFKFPPIFDAAVSSARKKIEQRAALLGVDMAAEIAEMRGAQDWDAELEAVTNPGVSYPGYYLRPFHAYPEGNLNWQAAFETQPAAMSVHAPVMDPEGKNLDPEGDLQLRRGYSAALARLMAQLPCREVVRQALDLGCATGLSSLELAGAFPEARVTALDLSPHFLAVARHLQRQRQQKAEAAGEQCAPDSRITYVHGAAEATGLPDESQDLVSISLVCHELPQSATSAVFREAFRLLRPGGVLAMMDQDPECAAFERMLGNPFAFAAFKSTEPWLTEYISLDIRAAMKEVGFLQPLQASSTPRHRTICAIKPQWLGGL